MAITLNIHWVVDDATLGPGDEDGVVQIAYCSVYTVPLIGETLHIHGIGENENPTNRFVPYSWTIVDICHHVGHAMPGPYQNVDVYVDVRDKAKYDLKQTLAYFRKRNEENH